MTMIRTLGLIALTAIFLVARSYPAKAIPTLDIWSRIALAETRHYDALYSATLGAMASDTVGASRLPSTVGAACSDRNLPANVRMFVSDILLSRKSPWHPQKYGENCRSSSGPPGQRASTIVGLSTFNNPWYYLQSQGTSPQSFYARGKQYVVPTMHFEGLAIVEDVGATRVIELHFRDQRYNMLLFPIQTTTASMVRSAAAALLSQKDPSDFYTGRNLRNVEIALPRFAIRTSIQTAVNGSAAVLTQIAALTVYEEGVGQRERWPGVPLHIFSPRNRRPIKATLDHPFYFVIVDWQAHSVLFLGYIEHPVLGW
jgi:hypothetical protein